MSSSGDPATAPNPSCSAPAATSAPSTSRSTRVPSRYGREASGAARIQARTVPSSASVAPVSTSSFSLNAHTLPDAGRASRWVSTTGRISATRPPARNTLASARTAADEPG